MTTTRIDITARDQSGNAFKSVDRNITALSGSVSKLTGLVGALGVGFTAVGAVSTIKNIIDANDALAKMSQSTGVAVESLAGLEFASSQSGTTLERTAKGVRAFSKIVLESTGETDRYGKVIKALGLNLDELKQLTPEEQFVKLAGAIRNNVSEQERATVVTSLLGDRYAELVPLLANGEEGLSRLIAEGKELNPVTAESAARAEVFNDNLDKLSRSGAALGQVLVNNVSPALVKISGDLLDSVNSGTLFADSLKNVALAATGFPVIKNVFDKFFGDGKELKQASSGIKEVSDTVDESTDKVEEAAKEYKSFAEILKEINAEADKSSQAIKKTATSTSALNKELKDEERAAESLQKDIRNLTLAYDPLIRRNEELARLSALLNAGLSREVFDAAAKTAIEDYMRSTGQLKTKVEDVSRATDELGKTSENVFDDISQFSIQAARSIQSSLADALLNSTDGFKSFADNVLNIIKRMAAEIASVKILEGLGVGALLTGSTSALAGSGAAGGGSGLLSLGANALSTGFGFTSLLSTAASGIGGLFGSGTMSAIGGGLGGDALGGLIAGIEGGLSGTAAAGASSLGASIASFAAPLAIAAAVDVVGRILAGDRKTGTIADKIPVIGGFAGALFGRGPLKQKDSIVRGTVGAGGIGDDFLTATNFEAKGSVFRDKKIDRVIINANTGELVTNAPGLPESGISDKLLPFAGEASKQALEIGQLFDNTIKGFTNSMRQSADVLGLNTAALDGFNTWLQLTADGAEGITDAQVSEALQNISDQMAGTLVPNIENFARGGETATQALGRMTQEAQSLENALVILGVSSSEARTAVLGLSLAARTELVDAAGGVQQLNQQIAFFAQNFLSAEQQLELSFNALDVEMQKLGFSASISRDEFANLVQSVTQVGGITTETAAALLRLAPAFANVKTQEEQLAAQSNVASSAVSGLAGSIGGLSGAAANSAQAVQASFARIDAAREAVRNAEGDLAIAQANQGLADAQANLSAASNTLSQAQSNLSAAQSRLSTAQSNLASAESAAQQEVSRQINETISQRNQLISAYQEEAGALKSVVDRFGALSDQILDFKDSLNISNLSPFSPGEQLAIARRDFNVTRGLAAQGDEGALSRLPEVSRTFLEASKTFNGATGAFESDFRFVQSVLESSGATARATRDIAAEQLLGIESTISALQELNEAEQRSLDQLSNINNNVISVDQALAEVASAESDIAAAQAEMAGAQAAFNDAQAAVESATRSVSDATIANGGFINDVERATNAVESAVRELSQAVLQGFGNSFIRDQQIRDFVLANQQLTDQQFAQIAIANGISGNQLKNALAPLGVSPERINRATGGDAVSDAEISRIVDERLAAGDFMGIYNMARANGITSQRLASASRLSKEEIDNFVAANNLAPFILGTDFIPRDGIAMLHKGEAVVPSSTVEEIKALRQELIELRREQNRQMSALINVSIEAARENAKTVVKANKDLAVNAQWINRVKAVVR